jgi:hypothetical protein
MNFFTFGMSGNSPNSIYFLMARDEGTLWRGTDYSVNLCAGNSILPFGLSLWNPVICDSCFYRNEGCSNNILTWLALFYFGVSFTAQVAPKGEQTNVTRTFHALWGYFIIQLCHCLNVTFNLGLRLLINLFFSYGDKVPSFPLKIKNLKD